MDRCTPRVVVETLLLAIVCGVSSTAPAQQGPNTVAVNSQARPPVASPVVPLPNVPSATPNNQPPAAASFNAQVPGPLSTQLLDFNVRDWAREVEQRLERLAKEQAAASVPSVTVGGRIEADWALFDQSAADVAAYGNIQNGCEFRRTRIFVGGSAFEVIDYSLEMDFANGINVISDVGPYEYDTVQSTTFEDVYIGINELPLLGHVRLGHFKEPFSLERVTSERYFTFMERSLGDYAFSPGRNTGIMAFDWSASERMTWAIGAFRTAIPADPPIRQNDRGGISLTTRGTWLPWYDEGSGGRGLLHLGIAYSYRDVDEFDPDHLAALTPARFRARPEANLGPFVVDTDEILGADYWQLVGTEAAIVYGPLSFQTEYSASFVHRPGAADLGYHGVYAYLSYFLTGEHRVYNRRGGRFARVVPFENFFRVRDSEGYVQTGKGAWEVAYRYSYVDLNDPHIEWDPDLGVWEEVRGGYAGAHTLGLNWYLNPYTRVMWNYVYCRPTAPESRPVDPPAPAAQVGSSLSVFEMRAQIDF